MRAAVLFVSVLLMASGCAPGTEPNVSGSIAVRTRFIPISIRYNFATHQFEICIDESVDIGFLTFSLEAAATNSPPKPPAPTNANEVFKLVVTIGDQKKSYPLDPKASYSVQLPNDLTCQSTVSVHDGEIDVTIPHPSTMQIVDDRALDEERAKTEMATAEAQTLRKDLDKTKEELAQTKMENQTYPDEVIESPKEESPDESKKPEDDPGFQPDSYPELPGDTSRLPGGTPVAPHKG